MAENVGKRLEQKESKQKKTKKPSRLTKRQKWLLAVAIVLAVVLVAVVAIAINTVIIKPQLERLGTLVVMGWYYIIGLAVTAPFFWKYIAHTQFLKLPLQAQAELAYILILGTVLPMYLLYRGTEKLTSVHTALYRYIQPVSYTHLRAHET